MAAIKTLLAMDAAGKACSAAVWRADKVTAQASEDMARGQSERLVPMIEAVMAQAALDYEDLDAIAVTLGPGGFTGVRIGLATARGLALACDLPLIGVSNLEVVATAVPRAQRAGHRLVVVLDAKRAELYAQSFDDSGRALDEAACVLPEELVAGLPPGPLLLAGDAVAQAQPALSAAGRAFELAAPCTGADAAEVAALAAGRPLPAPGAPPPRPLYLRPPDVTRPGRLGGPKGRRPA